MSEPAPDNPYRPPPPQADGPPPTPAAGGRAVALYSPAQVVLSAFLGTPMAGALLMALNYRRLGEHRSARRTAAGGLLAAAALVGVASLLPEGAPQLGLNVAVLLGVYRIAQQLQGGRFAAHLAQGGEQGSSWTAVGLGLGCALLLLVIILAFFLVLKLLSPTGP